MPPRATITSPDTAPAPPAATAFDRAAFGRAIESLRGGSSRVYKSLSVARVASFESNSVTLAFSKEHAFHRATVFGSSRGSIEDSLSKFLGRSFKLAEAPSSAWATSPPSVSEVEASRKDSHEKSVDALVREHPAVNRVLEMLGGSLESVRVLGPPADAAPVFDAPEDERS